nr:carotenoid oxygenase family protein [Petrachloros mirabilis]
MQTVADTSFRLSDWQGGHESLKQEHSYWLEAIEGKIPTDLQGTLFRNGPGLLDVNGQRLHHPFDGDGMVCAFTFDQGRVYFRNRFVRTEGFVAEQQAGTILYRGVFGTAKPGGWLANALDLRIKNIANTNVIYWGGKLLALWEGGQPHRLDPTTLETLGIESLDGLLQSGDPFSAHPIVDPGGEDHPPRLVNFSIQPGLSTQLKLYEFDLSGTLLQSQTHSIPGFAFIHDFALTPNYYLLFQNPVTLNPIPYVLGLCTPGQALRFNAYAPTHIWVISRQGDQPIRKLQTEACFVFHHANAQERDGKIWVDSICYESFPTLDAQQDYRTIDFNQIPAGQLWRYELDLQTATATRRCLSPRSIEFPTVHPDHVGRPYRFVYLGAADQHQGNAPLQAILKLDLETGHSDCWSAAPQGFVSEPIFVPKEEGAAQADAEDQGWLLVLVYNAAQHRSELVVLDAAQVSQGPVACLPLRHHIPYGLHGSFSQDIFL